MNKEKFNPWNWFSHEDDKDKWIKHAKDQSKGTMEYMQKELESLRETISGAGSYLPSIWQSSGSSKSPFRPKADIIENGKSYKVILEIPGVAEEDINVESNDNVLKITGEKKQESEEEGEDYHSSERYYGKFQRVISLPEDVDHKKIEAEYKDGLVKVTLPRNESASSNTKKTKLKKSA